ncbi:MAG: class I SAM-dependent methyltransferase [Candidatus Hydrogenedentota bacterium]
MADRIASNWYESAFNALYPIIYAHRTAEAALPEAEFAAKQVALAPEDRLLDLCCGNGRHMVHLRNHVRRVVGLDFSGHLLALAKQNCGDDICAVRGNMRTLPFAAQSFDVVVNFFTSFGYFAKDADNAAVLGEISRVLSPGGRFFIDYVNVDNLRNALVKHSQRQLDAFTIVEQRWIDDAAHRINKRTVLTCADRLIAAADESVRLYTHEEMRTMCKQAGLEITRVAGDYGGAPFNDAHPRMILIGKKSARHG